jgi:hypothetical protein
MKNDMEHNFRSSRTRRQGAGKLWGVLMMVRRIFVCALSIALFASGDRMVSAQDTPSEDLAAQARLQGNRCEEPVTVQRDVQLSKPDEVVWNLRCSNASYRMHLIPDLAARIEKLD